jgi:hypothetical protein
MLTWLHLSVLVIGGNIAITLVVGELVDFGEGVGRRIEGVGDSMAQSLSSLSDASEGVLWYRITDSRSRVSRHVM